VQREKRKFFFFFSLHPKQKPNRTELNFKIFNHDKLIFIDILDILIFFLTRTYIKMIDPPLSCCNYSQTSKLLKEIEQFKSFEDKKNVPNFHARKMQSLRNQIW